jgi:hypothetical protein
MKKIILITFTTLLLFSCVQQSTSELLDSGKIYIGMDKQKFSYATNRTEFSEDPFKSNCYRYYFPNLKKEVLSSKSRNKYYVFENVSKPSSGECGFLQEKGDGVLVKILDSIPEVEKYVSEKIIIKEVVKTPEIKKEAKAEVKKENTNIEKQVVQKKKIIGKTVWTKTVSTSEFYGTSEKQIVSSWIKPTNILQFPYQDSQLRIVVPCSRKNFVIYIQFNHQPNLIDGKYRQNSNGELYFINVKSNDGIFLVPMTKEFSDDFLEVSSVNFPFLTAEKEITFEFKHYVGKGYYTFDMVNFPEDVCK